jgi:hypothetical protein
VLLVQAYFENHWAKNNCQLYIVLKQLQTHMQKNFIQLQNRMVSHNVGARQPIEGIMLKGWPAL